MVNKVKKESIKFNNKLLKLLFFSLNPLSRFPQGGKDSFVSFLRQLAEKVGNGVKTIQN